MTPSSTQTTVRDALSEPIELVVFDMAGTTVSDDGLVERAFAVAAAETKVTGDAAWEDSLAYVRRTMGQSKIDVFTHLAGGDVARAEEATQVFERAFAELVGEGGAEEIPGAGDLLRDLRTAGIAVALTTGFAPITRDAILSNLGWSELADVALAPADAGRGRPAPDLVLTAVLRTNAHSMARVAVVGDTASDVESGLRAGAGLVIGVLSGAHDRAALDAAGAHLVVDDVTQLRGILLPETLQ